MNELISVPEEFVRTSILKINNSRQLVASLTRGDETREYILVDLFDAEDNFDPKWGGRYLAFPASSFRRIYGFNDSGMMFARFTDDASGESRGLLLDATDPEALPEVLCDPVSGLSMSFYGADCGLNNLGQVFGNVLPGDGNATQGFRLTPGLELLFTPLGGLVSETTIVGMSDAGVLTGEARVKVTTTGRKGKTATTYRWGGIRYDGTGYEVLTMDMFFNWSVNNENDVLGHLSPELVLYHDSKPLKLDELLVGEPEEMTFWMGVTNFFQLHLSDRDETGYGQVFVGANLRATTGKGKNQTTTTDARFYILTPERPY